MGTQTVAPACALVDRLEDFVTPLEAIALLRWAESRAAASADGGHLPAVGGPGFLLVR